MTVHVSVEEMSSRLVRYADLVPCTSAFIDTRTPGSDRKENFTIIGPGVAENPEQHVHIRFPHGFNVGGARQPPHCVNSQHSHETAEVFIVHTGEWRFRTGHDGRGPHVDLSPGDTISIPVRVFRGFENVGNTVGFMFALLGGDDPGRVTWAPRVFEDAAEYGLVLLETGRLIDTKKETVPEGARPMRATTAEDLDNFATVSMDQLESCVQRFAQLRAGGGLTAVPGFEECPIIGRASVTEGMPAGKLDCPHGFQLRSLQVAAHARSAPFTRLEEEVILMHRGRLDVEWSGGRINLEQGDTLTVPKGLDRILCNPGEERAIAFIVRGGDQPGAALWSAPRSRAG